MIIIRNLKESEMTSHKLGDVCNVHITNKGVL